MDSLDTTTAPHLRFSVQGHIPSTPGDALRGITQEKEGTSICGGSPWLGKKPLPEKNKMLPSQYLKKCISSSFCILASYCGVLLALHIGIDIFA
jgi:hypothetical protein